MKGEEREPYVIRVQVPVRPPSPSLCHLSFLPRCLETRAVPLRSVLHPPHAPFFHSPSPFPRPVRITSFPLRLPFLSFSTVVVFVTVRETREGSARVCVRLRRVRVKVSNRGSSSRPYPACRRIYIAACARWSA